MTSRLAVAGVALLLLATVGAANVVIAVERTALNEEYVSNTLESEGVYESLAEEAQASIESEIASFSPANSDRVPAGVDFSNLDAQQLAADAVPEAYVRSQANANVDRVFAYLHGDRSEPALRIDTDPLEATVSDAVSEQVAAVDPAVLLNGASFDIEGYEVDGELAQEMYDSRARYEGYRSEIRARTDAQERQQINSEAKSDARQRTQQATSQYNQQITQGTITIQEAVIDGLTDDEMTYEEFRQAYDAGRSQIADGAGQAAANAIDERVGGQISPAGLADTDLEPTLADARDPVQTMDTLQIALPIAALLLLALLYGITRAWQPTAKAAGKVFVTAGVLALVAVLIQSVLLGIVEDRVGSQLETNDVVGMGLVTRFVEGIFETLTIQSGVLVVFGLVLVGLVYADTNGYLDGVKRSLGIEPAAVGGSAGRQSSQTRQQPPQHQSSARGQSDSQARQPTQAHPESQPQQPTQARHDSQPRQPTGRSIARQGPQDDRSHRDQRSQEQPPTESRPDDSNQSTQAQPPTDESGDGSGRDDTSSAESGSADAPETSESSDSSGDRAE